MSIFEKYQIPCSPTKELIEGQISDDNSVMMREDSSSQPNSPTLLENEQAKNDSPNNTEKALNSTMLSTQSDLDQISYTNLNPENNQIVVIPNNSVISNVKISRQSNTLQINKNQNDELEYSNTIEYGVISTLSKINQLKSDENNQRDIIDQLIRYCPTPKREIDSNGITLKNGFNNYCDLIDSFKSNLVYFKSYFLEIAEQQSKIKKKMRDFKLLQQELIQRTLQIFQLSYKVSKEEYLSSYEDNKQLIKECLQLKEELDIQSKNLKQKSLSENLTELNLFFNQIYGFSQNEQEKNDLLSLMINLTSLSSEREQNMKRVGSEFVRIVKIIDEKQISIEYASKLQAEQENYIAKLQQELKDLEEQMKNYSKKEESDKQKQIQEISEQLQSLQSKIHSLDEQEFQEKEEVQNKKTELMNQLTQCRFQSISPYLSLSSKTCFHYVYLIDESGSFEGIPHDTGINGIIECIEQQSEESYVGVIKFDDSASIKFPKTQKGFIEISDLRKQIQKCRSGGTNFSNAFKTLYSYVQSNVLSSEQLVVIFITDGQDNYNANAIAQSIQTKCGDTIFFSVGYGNINEQQLKTLTNTMNNSFNCQKSINGKTLELLYLNETPEKLQEDVKRISKYCGSISTQDIANAKQAFEEFSKESNDNITAYISSSKKLLKNQIQSLLDQKDGLEASNIKDYEKYYEQRIERIKTFIADANKQIISQKEIIQSLKNDIEENKNHYQMLYPEVTKSDDLKQVRDEQQNLINKMYESSKTALEEQIQKIKKEAGEDEQKKLASVRTYGFLTIEQFDNLYKVFNDFEKIYLYFQETLSQLQDMVSYMWHICRLLDKNIESSSHGLKTLEKTSLGMLVQHYSEYDPSIDEHDFTNAKKKILILADNSAYYYSATNNQTKTYEDILNSFPLEPILQTYEEKDQKNIDKIFKKEIQEKISGLQKPQVISSLEVKQEEETNKIEQQKQELKELKLKLASEQNENKQEQLEKKIEQLESKIETSENNKEKIQESLDSQWDKYYEKNEVKIQIARMIYQGFRKAAQNSMLRSQFMASKAPFRTYVNVMSGTNLALKDC